MGNNSSFCSFEGQKSSGADTFRPWLSQAALTACNYFQTKGDLLVVGGDDGQ
jgi:hypothetical protein